MDETWYTDVTSQEDDKKVIKSACFYFTLQSRIKLDTRYSTRDSSIRTI